MEGVSGAGGWGGEVVRSGGDCESSLPHAMETEVSESPDEKERGKVVTGLSTGNSDLGNTSSCPVRGWASRRVGRHPSRLQGQAWGGVFCLAWWRCQEQGRLLRGGSSLLVSQGFVLRVSELNELLLLVSSVLLSVEWVCSLPPEILRDL